MKNMKIMISILLFFGLVLSQLIMVSADNTSKDDEVVRTIDEINEIRAIYDLPSLHYNVSLNRSANLHNRYMVLNNVFSSIEESGNLYYRGRYPWDRASYNNYDKSYVFELLMKDTLTYSGGLSQLMENPYSRYSILDPLYVDIGMNTYENHTTYLLGGTTREFSYVVVYPYDQQEEIATTFENKYIIDPYINNQLDVDEVGMPITLSVYAGVGDIKSFEQLDIDVINTETGEIVNVMTVTSLDDRDLNNTIMILPLESYSSNTTYRINIEGTLYLDHLVKLKNGVSTNRIVMDHSSTFTTKAADDNNYKYAFTTRAEFVEILLKETNIEIVESLEPIFPDVSVVSPIYRYIYTAYKNKIIEGYDDGYYRPEVNISRQQAYTIIMRTYESEYGPISLDEEDRILEYSDVDLISDYAKDPIRKAIKVGMLQNSITDFNAKRYITNEEFDQIIQQYMKVINEM